MLSLQGCTPIWRFSMIISKTFDKYFSQIKANLPPWTPKKVKTKPLERKKYSSQKDEKYLGDQIHTNGLAASILSTTDKIIGKVIGGINVKMKLAENPQRVKMRNSLCAQTLYKKEIVTSLLNNSASRIGIIDSIKYKLQDFQNRFMLRFVKVH